MELWVDAPLVDIALLNEVVDFERITIASKIIIVASSIDIAEIVAYFIVVALLKIIPTINNWNYFFAIDCLLYLADCK